MKKWKDGKNRYELHISNIENHVVMYYDDKNDVFYVRAFIESGTTEKLLEAKDLVAEKVEVEKWLIWLYKARISFHRNYIKTYKKLVQELEEV